MLDEGLGVLAALLTGEPVDHHGEHYTVDGVALAPLPLRPIPFWIGGCPPRALRRAARWDGWLADGSDPERNRYSPDETAELVSPLRRHGAARTSTCFIGYSEQADLAAYAAAGVTWWIENVRGDVGRRPPARLSGPARRDDGVAAATLAAWTCVCSSSRSPSAASPPTAPARCGTGLRAARTATTR